MEQQNGVYTILTLGIIAILGILFSVSSGNSNFMTSSQDATGYATRLTAIQKAQPVAFDTIVSVCGNNITEPGEQCDIDDLGGYSCADIGSFSGGNLSCSQDCMYDTTQCIPIPQICGNGFIDPGEDCDGTNLENVHDCHDIGYKDGGNLSCYPLGSPKQCKFNLNHCIGGPACGNRIKEPGEQCDYDDLGGATCESIGFTGGTLGCAPNCAYWTTRCINNITTGITKADILNMLSSCSVISVGVPAPYGIAQTCNYVCNNFYKKCGAAFIGFDPNVTGSGNGATASMPIQCDDATNNYPQASWARCTCCSP